MSETGTALQVFNPTIPMSYIGWDETEGEATTTSVAVAQVFEKLHKDVLKDIRNLLKNQQVEARRIFAPGQYKDANGQMRPMYTMTRDGFDLLVMGFTGEKALAYKLAYIDCFKQVSRIAMDASRSAAMRTIKEAHALELDRAKEDRGALIDTICAWQERAHVAEAQNVRLLKSSEVVHDFGDTDGLGRYKTGFRRATHYVQDKIGEIAAIKKLNAQNKSLESQMIQLLFNFNKQEAAQ